MSVSQYFQDLNSEYPLSCAELYAIFNYFFLHIRSTFGADAAMYKKSRLFCPGKYEKHTLNAIAKFSNHVL